MFTTYAMRGSRDACFTAGMDDYLAKPFTPAALLDITARWLRKAESGFEPPGSLVPLVGAGNAEEVAGTPHETLPGHQWHACARPSSRATSTPCNAP